MSASITTGKKENNSSARSHPDNSWTVMNHSLLEARKFCKLFPKRKANEFQAENDSRHVESKPEPYSKTSQSVPSRGAIYTNGSQPACVWTLEDSENSDFARIHAGQRPNSLQHCPLPHFARAHSCSASQSSVRGTQLGGATAALRGHWAPTLFTAFLLAVLQLRACV